MTSVWQRFKTAFDQGDGLKLSAKDVKVMYEQSSVEDEIEEQLIIEMEKDEEPL